MTLSPVFRSTDAIESLNAKGYLSRLGPAIARQRDYAERLNGFLAEVIDGRYIGRLDPDGDDDLTFLQEHFFLVLFDAVFAELGCPEDRLKLYGLLNLCTKGLVTSGDNLFDEENKAELPLSLTDGWRFQSIMQLLCFDHLVARILEVFGPPVTTDTAGRYRRSLLSNLASIGALEGSEEAGVDAVPTPEDMVRTVHAVRGGKLFSLAFLAPGVWEPEAESARWRSARQGITHLGTAFQMVDDVTDFEFDLGRRSHNLVAAEIVHHGTPAEQAAFRRLTADGARPEQVVEKHFAAAANAVLGRARAVAEEGFKSLAACGFWYAPQDAGDFIRAIAGDAGEERMAAIASGSRTG
jgi:hypothetical protein